jgi:hypothetical protein
MTKYPEKKKIVKRIMMKKGQNEMPRAGSSLKK